MKLIHTKLAVELKATLKLLEYSQLHDRALFHDRVR